MKKLILATLLAATAMTSAVSASEITIKNIGGFVADVWLTDANDENQFAGKKLLIGQSLTVETDNPYTITAAIHGSGFWTLDEDLHISIEGAGNQDITYKINGDIEIPYFTKHF